MKIGIDVEEIKRFSKLVKNQAFVKRIFSENEIKYCSSKKDSIRHFAVRFAGKEAVWKVLPRKKNITITSISFKNDGSGKPEVFIDGKKTPHIDVSFSHSENTAVAVALYLK